MFAKRWRFVLLGFAVWTILATMAGSAILAYRTRAGLTTNVPVLFAESYLDWYSCAIFTPFIFWLVRRFPLRNPGLALDLAVHIAANVAFVALKFALFVPIARELDFLNRDATVIDQMIRGAFSQTLTYWVIVHVAVGLQLYREAQVRRLREVELERSLAEAKLQALSAQLHPHFLFNALNAVATLMHRDVAAADRMVLELGELLRASLNSETKSEHSVGEEMRLAEQYLNIMRIRFGDRLAVRIDVEPQTRHARIPHLLLQPLIENAVRHGLERDTSTNTISVSVARANGRLEVVVKDNGPGFSVLPPSAGVGLENTRERLQQLYGHNAQMRFENVRSGGAEVRVTLPYREVDE